MAGSPHHGMTQGTARFSTKWAAVLILAGIAVLAVAAPLVTPYLPDGIDLAHRRAAPSFGHLFGTDELGRDVFSRTLHGARISLSIGIFSALLTGLVGTAVGAISGYRGGWSDEVLMRVTDAVLAIPRLPLLMIAAAILDPSVTMLILLVGMAGWMETARVVRAECLSVSTRPFVEAARAGGVRARRIVVRHVLPNAAPAAIVATTLAVGRGILLESAMSFFGVGVQPPTASWGNMLYQAQTTMSTEPWVAVFPGLFIFATVLCVNLVGQELSGERRRGAEVPRRKRAPIPDPATAPSNRD
jgi:peptide/nickel transport system permease protein